MPQNDSAKLLDVIAKSWTDDGYKKKLLADPKSVLTSEGIHVPEGTTVKVIDQQPNEMHLILPPKPAGEINVRNLGSHLAQSLPMTGPAASTPMTGPTAMTFHGGPGGGSPAKGSGSKK